METNIQEYSQGLPVEFLLDIDPNNDYDDGRFVLKAGTVKLDLKDILRWVGKNRPDLMTPVIWAYGLHKGLK